MNYQDQMTLLRFKLVEEFGGEDKRKLMQGITTLMRYQKQTIIKKIEENIDKL